MQSPWGNVGHNAGQDGQPAEPLWPEPYGFGPQTDQFDNVSTWAQQPIQGQMAYQEIGQNSTSPPVQFFHPQQGGPLAGIPDQNNQHNFHLNHHQHHAAQEQSISSEDYDMADAYDPSKFDFGHQVSDMASQPQSEATSHLRDHQGQHHAVYGFIGQEGQQQQQQQQPAFDHRTMTHFMPRQPITPMGQSYSDDQDQTFATGSAPQQRHQQGQPGQQQQQQDTSPSFAGTAVYHHQPAGYHPGLALQYGQHPRQQQHLGLHPQQPVAEIQHLQPQVLSQPATPQPPHPSQFPQLPLSSQISSQVLAQQTQQARISPVPLPGQVVDPQNGRGAVHPQHLSPHLPSHVSSHVSDSTPANAPPSGGSGQDPTAEPAAKKRRKAATSAKKPAQVDISLASTPERVDSPAGVAAVTVVAGVPKKSDGVDILPPPPTPTSEEQDLMTRFARRKPAEKARFPAIKGLPHLITTATTKLSITKIYDRLAHLVAMPSRSRKPMVPEFGCDLPCEIQGRFASSYKPVLDAAATRPRVEQRKAEADALLQHYENDMKKLGRRRPKYTEYPNSFKEQLKADEAIKMKAERRARKEKESKPIRPDTRPDDHIEAAVWEILGVVHLDSAAAAGASTRNGPFIAQAVQRAGDIIVRLRGELNRAKQRHDQAVKDEDSDEEIGDARQEMEMKAEAFFRAMDACLEYADDGILENLGGHQKLILALVNTLIACIKVHDFNGKMVKVVLELIGSFSLTDKSLANTNYTAVRQRLMDKGDDEVREFLREISAHIKKGSSSGSGSANPGTAAAAAATGNAIAPSIKSIKSMMKSSSSSSAASSSTAGISAKRSRDDDGETRTVKKIAVESNSLSKKMGPQKYALTSASKITHKTSPAAATAAAGMPARQIRPLVKAIPKPDTDPIPVNISQPFPIFPTSDGDAKSEAKTESRTEPLKRSAMTKTDASRPTSARPLEAARVTTSRSPPPASTGALSGIASILDSINAPRSETAQARDSKPASGTAETTEERERRLRKETRRHLRVMWKPDGELEQVRIFSKDAHENEGRATNMTRDAADDKSEGMVLKQRASMVDDDDEDDDEDDDIPYQPWMAPTSADFAAIPEHVRAKNFVTRAGAVTFSTGEQRYMAEREQRELMAVYTDPADIPPTPRSPPAESGDPAIEGKIIPLADKYEEIHRRWSDAEKLGSDAAAYYAIQRLDAAAVAAAAGSSVNTIPSLTNGAVRVVLPAGSIEAQVLYLLNLPHIRNWKDIPQSIPQPLPSSDGTVQAARDAFTASMQRMARKTFPATQPPEWLTDTELIREWWMGLNRDMATKAKREAEEAARAAAEQEAAALQQQAQQAQTIPPEWAAYYAQQQYLAVLSQTQGQAQHPDGGVGASQQQPGGDNPQLQAILAQMGQAQAQQALSQSQSQLQPPSPGFMNLNSNDPTYAQLMLLQQMAQQQQQQQPASDRGRDWERDRDGDHDQDRDGDWEMSNGRDGRDGRDGSREGRERDRDGRGDNSRKGGGGTTKKVTLPPHKPANSALIGTKPCTFWRQGKCARGDSCTFRHD